MECDFQVGDEVICIDASGTASMYDMFTKKPVGPPLTIGELQEGAKYTIRWVGPYTNGIGEHAICVRLKNFERPEPLTGEKDMPFRASRFRKVQKKSTETGMSILTDILKRESIGDKAPVKPKKEIV